MHYFYYMFSRVIAVAFSFFVLTSFGNRSSKEGSKRLPIGKLNSIFADLQLSKIGLSESVFKYALSGWQKLAANDKIQNNILTICDFSQSANAKRLYIIDLEAGKLLFNSLVAHGRNTGEEFARNFSNEPSSYKSSLGFYVTQSVYQGKHGFSLKLEGVERGFNNNAMERAIVMHGADYVSENFITQHGRLGRSLGCPSVPTELAAPIIETIKDGTCLFIYYPDKKYLGASSLVR